MAPMGSDVYSVLMPMIRGMLTACADKREKTAEAEQTRGHLTKPALCLRRESEWEAK